MMKNKFFFIIIVVLVCLVSIIYAKKPPPPNEIINPPYNVSLIDLQEDLTHFSMVFEIQNINDTHDKTFNISFFFENMNLDYSKLKDITIEEWKPIQTQVPKTVIKNVDGYCSDGNGTQQPCQYQVEVTEYETKNVLGWEAVKIRDKFFEKDSKFYGYWDKKLLPKKTTPCQYDDLGQPYNCDGTRRFRISWTSALEEDKFGVQGYLGVFDGDTGFIFDPPFSSQFTHKRLLLVNNTINNQERANYQFSFVMPYQEDMQEDFSDLRITWLNRTSNEEIEIPYFISWINGTAPNSYAVIDVKIPLIYQNETKLYVYYGNTTPITTTGNPHAVYTFYDDFHDFNANWTTYAFTGDRCSFYNSGTYEQISITSATGNSNSCAIRTVNTYCNNNINCEVKASMKIPQITGNDGYHNYVMIREGEFDYWQGSNRYTATDFRHSIRTMTTSGIYSESYSLHPSNYQTSWNMYGIRLNTTHAENYINGIYSNSTAKPSFSGHSFYIGTGGYDYFGDGVGTTIMQIDWISVRENLFDKEPSYQLLGEVWWNSSFTRRQKIIVNNTQNPNDLYNYQIFANITYDSDMQNDFDDLRFTWFNNTNNSEVEIPYWIEKKVNGQFAELWFKVPFIKGSDYETVYVYYKNPTAQSVSNGTNTFIKFDDFTDGIGSSWDYVYEMTSSDGYALNTNFGWNNLEWRNGIIVSYAVRISANGTGTYYTHFPSIIGNPKQTMFGIEPCSINYYGVRITDVYGGHLYCSETSYPLGSWVILDVLIPNNETTKFYVNGSYVTTLSAELSNTNWIAVLARAVGYTNNDKVYIDYTFVRNYSEPEPAISIFGEEIYEGVEENYLYWDSVYEKLPSGVNYNSSNVYGFQINVTTNYPNIPNVSFVSNITGEWKIYNSSSYPTVQNTGKTFYINFTNDEIYGAGQFEYYWIMYINSIFNSTPNYQYVINKGYPLMNLHGITNLVYPNNNINIYFSENNAGDDDVYYKLFRNDTEIIPPDTTDLPAGSYVYKVNNTEGQNYTTTEYYGILNISKGTPNFDFVYIYTSYFTYPEPPYVYTWENNKGGSDLNYILSKSPSGSCTYTSLFGIDYFYNSTIGYSPNVTLTYPISAGACVLSLVVNSSLTYQNYTVGLGKDKFVVVKPADTKIYLYFNGTQGDASYNYGSIINITATINTTSLGINLDMNATGYGTNFTFGIDKVEALIDTTTLDLGKKYNITAWYNGANYPYDFYNKNYSFTYKTNYIEIVDQESPTYSNVKENPTSPTTYAKNKQYQFNITWYDNYGIDEVIFEWNNARNYSYKNSEVSKNGNEYFITLSDLSAGTYNYKWYANDTSNNFGVYSNSYTINKATPILNLQINGTSSDRTITWQQIANISAFENNEGDSDITYCLLRNSNSIGCGSYVVDMTQKENATYIYSYTNNAGQNYTSSSVQRVLYVEQEWNKTDNVEADRYYKYDLNKEGIPIETNLVDFVGYSSSVYSDTQNTARYRLRVNNTNDNSLLQTTFTNVFVNYTKYVDLNVWTNTTPMEKTYTSLAFNNPQEYLLNVTNITVYSSPITCDNVTYTTYRKYTCVVYLTVIENQITPHQTIYYKFPVSNLTNWNKRDYPYTNWFVDGTNLDVQEMEDANYVTIRIGTSHNGTTSLQQGTHKVELNYYEPFTPKGSGSYPTGQIVGAGGGFGQQAVAEFITIRPDTITKFATAGENKLISATTEGHTFFITNNGKDPIFVRIYATGEYKDWISTVSVTRQLQQAFASTPEYIAIDPAETKYIDLYTAIPYNAKTGTYQVVVVVEESGTRAYKTVTINLIVSPLSTFGLITSSVTEKLSYPLVFSNSYEKPLAITSEGIKIRANVEMMSIPFGWFIITATFFISYYLIGALLNTRFIRRTFRFDKGRVKNYVLLALTIGITIIVAIFL